MDETTHRCLDLDNDESLIVTQLNPEIINAVDDPVIIDLCTPIRKVRPFTSYHKKPEPQMPQPMWPPQEFTPLRWLSQEHTNSAAKYTASTNSHEKTLICPICMESCYNRKPTSTKCGHIFCKSCIFKALQVRAKCPKCNKKLNHCMVFRIYLE